MLEPLLGSRVRELVLLFLIAQGELRREIALRSGRTLNLIQTQLQKLEAGE